MLEQNKKVRSKVPQPFEQLIASKLNQIDQVMAPGCTSITWVSPNVEDYINQVVKNLDAFDLLVTQANDLVSYRIEAVLKEMANIVLCEMNDEEPIHADEFAKRVEDLCASGAAELHLKSQNVEDATQELVAMLYPNELANFDDDEESHHEDEEAIDEKPGSKFDINSRHSVSKQPLTQAQLLRKRRKEQRHTMDEHARELLSFFNHKNLDAIVKLIKSTLEKIRKRINASQTVSYLNANEKTRREKAVFRCYAVLAIPNVTMQPTLDEVQQTLNKCVQTIVGVSKHIPLWSKERRGAVKPPQPEKAKKVNLLTIRSEHENSAMDEENLNLNESRSVRQEERPTSPTTTIQAPKNYFKSVSENKEIAKLVSLIMTCISLTKKDVLGALDRFKTYQYIWQKDRDEDLREFLTNDIRVSEFEIKIRSFSNLIDEINLYPELITVGAIALATEKLKMGFGLEIQLWKQYYGMACNQKYKKDMMQLLQFIDESEKKLQREIKDLDDIRLTMAALKEIRENEIRIDMTIIPVEESYAMLVKHEIDVSREDVERCDTLRYSWQKLLQLANTISSRLLELQMPFREKLAENLNEFRKETGDFYDNYRKVTLFYYFIIRFVLKWVY